MGSIYCYLLVKVGYPASFTQFPIEQTGSAFTLKHLALPQKRADEEQTYKHTNSNRSLDIPGEASTGAEPKRQRGTKWSHSLHKAAALSTAQVGKDTRQHARVGSHWLDGQGIGVGGKKPINLHGNPISTGRRLYIQQSLLQL